VDVRRLQEREAAKILVHGVDVEGLEARSWSAGGIGHVVGRLADLVLIDRQRNGQLAPGSIGDLVGFGLVGQGGGGIGILSGNCASI